MEGNNLPLPWIPAHRKPKPGQKVVATCIDRLGKRSIIMAKWLPDKFEECNCEHDCDCIHDSNFNCYHLPRGWYEVVENWHEWGFIPVTEGRITHWQPAPSLNKQHNPWCYGCPEKHCSVSMDGTCSALRIYREARKILDD